LQKYLISPWNENSCKRIIVYTNLV